MDFLEFAAAIKPDRIIECTDGRVDTINYTLYLRIPDFPNRVNRGASETKIFVDYVARGVDIPASIDVNTLLHVLEMAIEYNFTPLMTKIYNIIISCVDIDALVKIIAWYLKRGVYSREHITRLTAQIKKQINCARPPKCKHGDNCIETICYYCPAGELWSMHIGGCPLGVESACPYKQQPWAAVIDWTKYPQVASIVISSLLSNP